MLTLATIFAFFSKFKPVGDFFKKAFSWIKENPKTVRVIAEVLAGLYIIYCILTHQFGTINLSGNKIVTEYKDTTIYIPADTSKWTKMLGDTAAYYESEIRELKYADIPEPEIPQGEDSSNYLLDFYKRQLKLCDIDLEFGTRNRLYNRTIETDSFRLKYSLSIDGRLAAAPEFSIQHIFPSEKQIIEKTTHIYEPRLSRAIWVDVSAGPRMNYGKNISVIGAKAGLGFGYSDRKGYGYGVRITGADNYWSAEAVFRKSFRLER